MNLKERLGKAIDKFDGKEMFAMQDEKFRELNKVSSAEDSHLMKKEIFIFPKNGVFEREITIIPITDIHFGSKQSNVAKMQGLLNYILETPNTYTMLLGDQMETATKQSVGLGVYDEEIDVRAQLKFLSQRLKPLADAGKILGILPGNHEMRVAYLTSINPAELLADNLGVPYFGYQGYLTLKVGTQVYHVMCHHGAGGGTTPAGKVNAMRKLNQVADADIYLSGHTHGRTDDADLLWEFDDEKGVMRPRMRYYVVAGSYLEYWGGYAEMKCLPASITGSIALRLMPHEKKVQIIK